MNREGTKTRSNLKVGNQCVKKLSDPACRLAG